MTSNASAKAKPPAYYDYAGLFLLPLLYYFGVKFALIATVMPQGTAVMWPPNSVVLAAFLLLNKRFYPAIIVLSLLAETIGDMPGWKWYEGLGFGVINVVEAGLAALLLKEMNFDRRFSTLNDVLKFIVAALIMAASIGGVLGAALYDITRKVDISFIDHARIIWFGDALGILIFTPLWLSFWPNSGVQSPKVKLEIYDLYAGCAGLALLGFFISSKDGQVFNVHIGPTLLLPFLIYVGVRFEIRWAAFVTALIGVIIIAMVVKGREPFGPLLYRDAVIQTQEFIFIMSLLSMGSASLLTQLRRNQAQLETANISLNELNRHLEARILERTADLVEANARLLREIDEREVAEKALQRANSELLRLANVDGLTGIANRRTFDSRLTQEWGRLAREGNSLAVILLDIDCFKAFNDHYGHQAGDSCLKSVASILEQTVKRPGDLVARYGGEEFVIVLPETDQKGAEALAGQILAAVRELAILHEYSTADNCVTISLGISAAIPSQGSTADDLLGLADQALYRAKSRGRNCLEVSQVCAV